MAYFWPDLCQAGGLCDLQIKVEGQRVCLNCPSSDKKCWEGEKWYDKLELESFLGDNSLALKNQRARLAEQGIHPRYVIGTVEVKSTGEDSVWAPNDFDDDNTGLTALSEHLFEASSSDASKVLAKPMGINIKCGYPDDNGKVIFKWHSTVKVTAEGVGLGGNVGKSVGEQIRKLINFDSFTVAWNPETDKEPSMRQCVLERYLKELRLHFEEVEAEKILHQDCFLFRIPVQPFEVNVPPPVVEKQPEPYQAREAEGSGKLDLLAALINKMIEDATACQQCKGDGQDHGVGVEPPFSKDNENGAPCGLCLGRSGESELAANLVEKRDWFFTYLKEGPARNHLDQLSVDETRTDLDKGLLVVGHPIYRYKPEKGIYLYKFDLDPNWGQETLSTEDTFYGTNLEPLMKLFYLNHVNLEPTDEKKRIDAKIEKMTTEVITKWKTRLRGKKPDSSKEDLEVLKGVFNSKTVTISESELETSYYRELDQLIEGCQRKIDQLTKAGMSTDLFVNQLETLKKLQKKQG